MRLPTLIKGEKGWKARRLELLIMGVMSRATQPNSGWAVWQKLKRKVSTDGAEVCLRMKSLEERGYLKINGSDVDCGYLYEI